MTRTVVVLCPNARRETIKVNPNSSILQVLEEACKRQNINPEDYDLRHSNKILDLSLPIRFSTLANNAQVELRPIQTARKDSLVTVCVQLESGERFTADFTPSASVYDVAEQCLKSDSISMHDVGEPVCIYMRQKIVGDSLRTTTLRSLGLTKGKAIFRLLYRKPEDLEQQAHVSTPLVAAPIPQEPAPQQREYTQPDSPKPEPISKQPHLDLPADDFKPIEIKLEEKSSSEKETPLPKEYSNWDSVPIKEEQCNQSEDNIKMDTSDQVSKMECDVEAPEDTFQGVGDIKYIGERHAVLYSLDDITAIKKADLPDEFFDLTVKDVRYLMEEYKRQRSELENQPLLTKEQKQKNILQKLAQYNQTVIRVYFPERLVLQAVFSSVETVQAISDFIQNYLEDRNLNFYLYITPPKEKLNPSKTLLEALLVPAAVIYFGCESQQPNYLNLNLRDQLSDPRAASLAASESRKNTTNVPVEIISENVVKEEKILEVSNLVVRSVSHSENNQNPEKVPKWLKLSRK